MSDSEHVRLFLGLSDVSKVNRSLVDHMVSDATISAGLDPSNRFCDDSRELVLRSYQVQVAVGSHPITEEIRRAPYVVKKTDPRVDELKDILRTSCQAAFGYRTE